jgi:6-phosphogluconolactonase
MERLSMETRRMALTLRQTSIRLVIALLGVAGALSFTGCGNFFVCEGKASCPSSGSGGTGTNSGDYAYISNNSTNSSDLSVYDVSTGAPKALSSSPISLGYIPNAMVINPAGTIMFVSDPASSLIYAYSIGSTGALTIENSGTAVASQIASALAISPDGEYLYALDLTTDGAVLSVYAIGTNGVLTAATIPSYTFTQQIGTSGASITVAPSGSNFLVLTLGTAGDVIVPLANDQLNTANINPVSITFSSSATGDFGAAIDSNNNVYFARTTGIAVYNVASNGSSVTAVTNTSANSATGSGVHGILITGSYLYAASSNSSNISGFSFTSAGILTPLTGSPYTAPTNVGALGIDNTGKYLVASGYNSSSGTQVFTIGSAGALTASTTTAPTGTSPSTTPVVIAMTPE